VVDLALLVVATTAVLLGNVELTAGVVTTKGEKERLPAALTPVTTREYIREGVRPVKVALVEVEEEGITWPVWAAPGRRALLYTGATGPIGPMGLLASWNA
jgi:hypothetical protein